ncbi:hypothetical protein [Cetobacterium sp.]|uniref:hypothetical protein n=1 Tax=Cetobacterium sp. TaxID=2071632 RepID=UPI003F3BB418
MTVLENLRLLEEKELLDFVTSDLVSDEVTLKPEELLNIYSDFKAKVYNILPIETYEFLNIYFENDKKVPATNEFAECLNALKNRAIATFDERDLKEIDLMLDMKHGRIEEYPSEEFEEEKEYLDVVLDDEYAKSLFEFLKEKKEFVANDFKIRDIILNKLESDSPILLQKLDDMLKKQDLSVENILVFLENKMPYGEIVAYEDENGIQIAHASHLMNSEDLMN